MILGWARNSDGMWIELHDTTDLVPELTIFDVATKLNELSKQNQRMYWQYQEAVSKVRELERR